jgi:hypothetical protein
MYAYSCSLLAIWRIVMVQIERSTAGVHAHSGDDGRSFHAMAGKDSAAWWAD